MMLKTLLLSFLCFSLVFSECDHCSNLTKLQEVTIALIGVNDINGVAFPTNNVRSDTNESYTQGGLVYMASLIQTIRNQYGPENTLLMDAGDQFVGTIQSSSLVSSGKIMNDFFNVNKINASAIGNHEFDFGPSYLNTYLRRFPADTVLAANIYSETGKPVTSILPNTKMSKILQLTNGIKLGIIGLTTKETPPNTAGFINKLFPAYEFKNYTNIVIEQSKALKLNGAEIIVIVSHVGNECPGQSLDLGLWKNTTTQPACSSDQMSTLINSLPEGTVHAVIQGHRHTIAHYYQNNIPIIGVINKGFYLNAIYLKFNKVSRKIVDTTIEGPIPVCEKVFSNTKRCAFGPSESVSDVGNLESWSFHNVPVIANKRTKFAFEEYQERIGIQFSDFIVNNEVYLSRNYNNECALCNLMTEVLLEAVPGADISLLNNGGFRTTWAPGAILYQQYFNMFPFQNVVQTFAINGTELKQMFSILQQGPNGYYTAGGLQMKVKRLPFHSLEEIKFYNGTQIDDDANYTLVTIDFLINGGDDMSNVMGTVYTPRNLKTIGELRDVMIDTLKSRGTITQQMVIDPEKPRLEVVLI